MSKIKLHIVFLFSVCILYGQKYKNEWIDFSKTYYKIGVTKDGFYQVTYNELLNAGVPLNSFDPRSLKVYHRGNEVAVRIEGEKDGEWNPTDKLVFYGVRNDGAEETSLYNDPSHQVHDYYSLYSDTSSYFITWGGVSGKRISAITNTVASSTINQVQNEQLFLDVTHYALGNESPGFIFISDMDRTEGWFSGIYSTNKTFSYIFDSVALGGDDKMTLEVALVGRNQKDHKVQLNVGSSDVSTFSIDDFSGYKSKITTFDIPSTALENNQLRLNFLFQGNGTDPEAISIAYIKLRYTSETDLMFSPEKIIYTTTSTSGNANIRFTNTLPNSQFFDLSNKNAIKEYKGTFDNDELRVILSPSADNTKLLIHQPENNLTASFIRKVDFNDDLNELQTDYLMISHDKFWDESETYAQFRSSEEGGSYTPHLININRVFDQYNYGEKSPEAIRNLSQFFYDKGDPKYLLLIGKSAIINHYDNANQVYYRKEPNLKDGGGSKVFQFDDYVINAGYPGSDAHFTIGLDANNPLVPAIPVGRIPVRDVGQLTDYLNKVKEYESMPYDALWYKNLLHLSGGKTSLEQSVFRAYVDQYATIASSPSLGARTTTYQKENTDGIVFFDITGNINKGVSILTYFGHSAPNFVEIELGKVDAPENGYNNKGKYPILFLNGCAAGAMYSTEETRAENWVLAKDRGAIAAFAHSSFGYSLQLHQYCQEFYRELIFKNDTIDNKGIGAVQQKTIKDFIRNATSENRLEVSQIEQMVLIGDPAVKFLDIDLPDYAIKKENVSLKGFNNERVTVQVDSFQLKLAVDNFGLAVSTDSLSICVRRVYDNNQVTEELPLKIVKAPYYSDTIFLTVYNDSEKRIVGNNTFIISLDCQDSIAELSELNNAIFIDFVIPGNSLKAAIPKEYAIVGDSVLDLMVQSFDLLVDQNTEYLIQLDTTIDFNSPLIEKRIFSGAYATWNDLKLPIVSDSTVYFWRAKYANASEGQDSAWDVSSFTYISGKTGWGQFVFDQLRDNSFIQINADLSNDLFRLDTTFSTVSLASPGNGVNDFTKEILFRVGEQTFVSEATGTVPDYCILNGTYAVAFDRETSFPYYHAGLGNCGIGFLVDDFNTSNTGGQNAMLNYFKQYKQGDVIALFTIGNAGYSTWQTTLKTKLEEFGAKFLDSLQDGEPYIFVFRNGGEVLLERYGASSDDILTADFDVVGTAQSGQINSLLIGPGKNWSSMYKEMTISEEDSSLLQLFGINDDNGEVLLFSSQNNTHVEQFDLTQPPFDNLNLEQYNYLKMKFNVFDTTGNPAPQLKTWSIVHDPAPEGILLTDYVDIEKYNGYTVDQGDSLRIRYAFSNISNQSFEDSIKVVWQLFGGDDPVFISDTIKLEALKNQDTLTWNFTYPSLDLSGEYELIMFVNPLLQPECYYDNNVLRTLITILPDKVNPLLNVLFDDVTILNGDVVSPNPSIKITLRDNNQLIYKTDTLGWEIFLKSPCESNDCEFERISFSSKDVSWVSGSLLSPFQILMNPKNLKDGIYTLRIKATDAAGNRAGTNPYEITFKVVNENTISDFVPYPNPFSTSVRFVFTITGSVLPVHSKIRIYNTSGILVREISTDEIGELRIGTNITNYAWDGKDEEGNLLANGMYLFNVFYENDDQITRGSTQNNSINGDFGQLYILR